MSGALQLESRELLEQKYGLLGGGIRSNDELRQDYRLSSRQSIKARLDAALLALMWADLANYEHWPSELDSFMHCSSLPAGRRGMNPRRDG